jgi:hypothetical protein
VKEFSNSEKPAPLLYGLLSQNEIMHEKIIFQQKKTSLPTANGCPGLL